MTIGDRIKQRRVELGLTPEDLAKSIGKDRATVYRYEKNDIKNLPCDVLPPIARALHVSPAWLMGWGEDESGQGDPGDMLEATLIKNFAQLNREGQEKLVETSDDMVASGKYIKTHQADLGSSQA